MGGAAVEPAHGPLDQPWWRGADSVALPPAPPKPAATADSDSDRDGLAGFVETYFGTNPAVPDGTPWSLRYSGGEAYLDWPEAAPAGITVEDASTDSFDPASLQSGGVDAVFSGMAGKVGAGGTASMIDARGALRSGNGANLGTYGNARIDQIIDQLNVDASTSAQLGLSVEAENILWTQVPTIPLFNQLRTVAVAPGMSAVLVNPTRAATGWNMDRWVLRR